MPSKLSPAGAELLVRLERLERVLGPSSDEMLGRIAVLHPSDRTEISAIFGGMAQEFAERQRENVSKAAQAASFMEITQEARERAAGKRMHPNMPVGDALEILGR